MTKKLEDLIEKYPNAFDLDAAKERRRCGFGFECGDGWYDIIEPVIKAISDFNEDTNNQDKIYPQQVKSKFGTLRFYTGSSNYILSSSVVKDEINKAEDLSGETCEICGKFGSTTSFKGWLYTTCEEHKRKDEK
jgi:hypothetical protein